MTLEQAFFILEHGSAEGLSEYLKAIKTIKRECVPVVRCKDCKYSRPLNRADRLENQYYDGCIWCMEHQEGESENYYCGDGKRKCGAE